MTINAVDTREMLDVVETTKAPSNYFRKRFFGTERFSRSRKIDFDEIEGLRRVSPFVIPRVKGRLVAKKGYATKSFTPAYVKDLRIINPDETTLRPPGAPIGSAATPEATLAYLLSSETADMQEMLQRRIELMTVEALRTGGVTIVGEDYPEVVITFGRDGSLSGAIGTPFAEVDDADDPLREVKAMAQNSKKRGHVYPRELYMSQLAFDQLTLHPRIEKKLDLRNVQGNIIRTATNQIVGAQFMGTVDGFDLYTFDDWYIDPETGVEERMMPEDELIGASDVGGIMAFGAIVDFDAGVQSMEFFAKAWTEQDPSGMQLLGQSAPLPVPRRPNGSFRLTGVTVEESS